MSGIDTSGLRKVTRDVAGGASDVNKTITQGNKAVKQGWDLWGALFPDNQSGGSQPTGGTTPTSAVPSGAVIPKGTCIIIPADVSITKQPRYLGEHVYQSVVNLLNGNPDCANVIIVGEDGKPSPLIYDSTPNGLVLKGTNTPVPFNYDEINGVRTPTAVALTEKELQSVALGMKKQGKGKFTTSEQGEAEDADNRPWYVRYWQLLVLAGIAAIAGISAFLMKKKYNKQADSAKSQIAGLNAQKESLQTQIDSLTNGGNGNDGNSTLSTNAQIVHVSDTPLNTGNIGREF